MSKCCTLGKNPFISLRNIKKSFGHVVALDGVDLDVYSGEVTGC